MKQNNDFIKQQERILEDIKHHNNDSLVLQAIWFNTNLLAILLTFTLGLTWIFAIFLIMNNIYVEAVGFMVILFAGGSYLTTMNRRVIK